MKTKELIKKLNDKSVWHLVWAIWWRTTVAGLVAYMAFVLFFAMLVGLATAL